jgi:hypothetical protein
MMVLAAAGVEAPLLGIGVEGRAIDPGECGQLDPVIQWSAEARSSLSGKFVIRIIRTLPIWAASSTLPSVIGFFLCISFNNSR